MIDQTVIRKLATYFVARREWDAPHVARAVLGDGVTRTILNNTLTVVDYNSPLFDPYNLVTTGTNWVFRAKASGYYWISATLLFDGSTAWTLGSIGSLVLSKNGTQYSVLDRNDAMNSTGTAQYKRLHGVDLVYLAVNDTLRVSVYQSSGVSLTIYNPVSGDGGNHNYVSIAKI